MKKIFYFLQQILFPSDKQMEQWFTAAQSNPVYGSKVFEQKSWLEKQVDESLRKKAFRLE